MSDPLSAALATLRHRFGPQALHRGDQAERSTAWPTGVPVIDTTLTPGGLPRGRLTVLAASARGPSGRLTLLQSLASVASRSCDVGYVDLHDTLDPGFLADLGADLDACLVLSPGRPNWERGLVMARALVVAGTPWIGIALGDDRPNPRLWEHALVALVEAVGKRTTVCVVATPSPIPAPLAYASSLTLTCAAAGWQMAHGDVAGLRVLLAAEKSRVGAPGAEANLLLRYPRPYAVAEVIGLPTVVTPRLQIPTGTAAAAGELPTRELPSIPAVAAAPG
jgi:recA bacterial DNA recombination protein